MKTKSFAVIGAIIVVIFAIALMLVEQHQGRTEKALTANAPVKVQSIPEPVKVQPISEQQVETAPIASAEVKPAAAPGEIKPSGEAVADNSKSKYTPAPVPSIGSGKPPLVDPDARLALAFVGVDPDAEDYWLAAINDPSLPANERQDLIEDLNEVGISDPKHPAPEDLPVILSRIELLETLDPMDQVNLDAMKEAYKDLANLALLASGSGGKPVN